MSAVHCLVCEKELNFDDSTLLVEDAGFLYLEFHYGSRHDMCIGWESKPRTDDLLDVNLDGKRIEAFLCDDCFENKRHLFRPEVK